MLLRPEWCYVKKNYKLKVNGSGKQVAKGQIRQIISQNNINSVADVYSLLRESFKDILQEFMEAELDATLGYEKTGK